MALTQLVREKQPRKVSSYKKERQPQNELMFALTPSKKLPSGKERFEFSDEAMEKTGLASFDYGLAIFEDGGELYFGIVPATSAEVLKGRKLEKTETKGSEFIHSVALKSLEAKGIIATERSAPYFVAFKLVDAPEKLGELQSAIEGSKSIYKLEVDELIGAAKQRMEKTDSSVTTPQNPVQNMEPVAPAPVEAASVESAAVESEPVTDEWDS